MGEIKLDCGRIVGLTGYARSGKDTFARILVDEFHFKRVAFADALKSDLASYLGISRTRLDTEKEALRRALQLRGASLRAVDPTYWIRLAMSSIKYYQGAGCNVVVTDVRFPNEAVALRNMGAVILRMRRADQPLVTEDADTSERSIDMIDPDEVVLADSIGERQEMARAFGLFLVKNKKHK